MRRLRRPPSTTRSRETIGKQLSAVAPTVPESGRTTSAAATNVTMFLYTKFSRGHTRMC